MRNESSPMHPARCLWARTTRPAMRMTRSSGTATSSVSAVARANTDVHLDEDAVDWSAIDTFNERTNQYGGFMLDRQGYGQAVVELVDDGTWQRLAEHLGLPEDEKDPTQLSCVVFNLLNAFMQGGWIFYISPLDYYTPAWFTSPQFIIGVIAFAAGMFINIQSDSIIRHLRKPGDRKHYIPRGGMFRWVSSANYFGEFLEGYRRPTTSASFSSG